MNGEECLENELKADISFCVGECLNGKVDFRQSRKYMDEAEFAYKVLIQTNKRYKGYCLYEVYELLKKEGF